MIEQEQRIAIAEACGWQWKQALNGMRYAWFSPYSDRETDWYIHQHYSVACLELPDYLHDLNAMHEAERKLTLTECDTYLGFLCKRQKPGYLLNLEPVNAWVFHASATDRAEAFLRTLGLWKE